ncbi:tRNA dimethylallyltransferase [Consotaella salsifontis]|uniref:tRNA dimethylallyltransferase n=1 Tax=Consotaella salsifontis TaxID=1365950 RepID=A0A1T4RB60_9HYPH|nr:tRNA dimethylallyltransferase [Consotaella salsifontis]
MLRGKDAILIAGPTASGKSPLAVELASLVGGVVVNADSMQVYGGLRIVTARPNPVEEARAPHRLYGHIAPESPYSVGAWLREATQAVEEIRAEGRVPIFCGGTGLYFRALLGGLDAMPAIPAEVRGRMRAIFAAEGADALHARLSSLDKEGASRLSPGDSQRVLRALEVVEATGKPISAFQSGKGQALLDAEKTLKVVLTPERAVLRERIAARFDIMLEEGAVEEVAAFRVAYPAALGGTARKAIGVEELGRYLDGLGTLAEARQRAVDRTRQYAKRQETWFRHQFDGNWLRVSGRDSLFAQLTEFGTSKLTNG